jgi:signal transduction histidine kinase
VTSPRWTSRSRRSSPTLARTATGRRARIAQLEPRFAAIEREVDALVEINQKGGAESTANIRNMQMRELVTSALLSLVALITVLVVAALTIPLVARREEELERHAVEMENRNRELDAFAGRVAHDLRGPLTAINLSASRLSEQDSAVIRRGVGRMEALIDDLLSLSRIDRSCRGWPPLGTWRERSLPISGRA